MTKMTDDEVNNIIQDNRHLKHYLEEIEKKIDRPIMYSVLGRNIRDEVYPNLIYPTKGLVFVHIYRTKEMQAPEYHAIEPVLNDTEKEKLRLILQLIIKKVPEKKSVISDEDLREILKELIDEITVIDERAEQEKPV
ncbi:MAG: hypothetical protein KKC68_09380, partial [Candidatus Thermoplasmatota archaeon]|nr:hypothetical protein [Candidatus Thermoplasmatota archaeon]MBU1941969.1 hypothetical protein [Candidatus Thermoplasmatota archaeon]